MFEKLLYSAILLATCSLTVACTSDATETDEPESANEMRFNAGVASRSSLVTNESLASFTVYGNMVKTNSSSTPSNLFNAVPVTLTDGKWTYENTQYWFPGHTYAFSAIHTPNSENISQTTYNNEDATLTFRYTAPTDYTKASDILTATSRRIYESPATPVKFNFGHIMARINFVAKIDPAVQNSSITINSIVIRGIASRASYTFQPSNIAAGSKETTDMAVASWSVSSTPARISHTKNSGESISTGGSLELFPAADPLLIIPQPVTSDIEVELTYTRQNGTSTTVSGRLRTASSSHNYQWIAGRSYTYNFTLGVDDYILFSAPSVKPWDEDEGGNYIVVD